MSYFNQKKYTLGLVLLLVVLNFMALATLWSNNHRRFPPHRSQHFLEAELKLSETQQKQFSDIRKTHFERMGKADKEIHKYKKAMFQELIAPKFNDSTVDSLTQQIGKWESRRQQYIFQHFQELKSVCTSQQQEAFGRVFQEVITQPMPQPKKGRGHPPRH